MHKVNLEEKFGRIPELWDPHVVGAVGDTWIKLARIQGEFVWHSHADEEEMFFVARGELTIRFRDHDEVLGPGELIVIPRGVEHMPVAGDEVWIMLVEPKSTKNTGDVVEERTQTEVKWI